MKNKIFSIVLLIALSLSLTNCVTNGLNFSSRTDWIKVNETSQKDVRTILGTPYAVGNSAGIPTWTYIYYQYDITATPNHKQKELKLYWSPDQTVKHFSFNSSFPEDIGLTQSPSTEGANEIPSK